eukprot:gene13340-15365_t
MSASALPTPRTVPHQGGSAQLVPRRTRKISKTNRKENAKARLLVKLGSEKLKEIQEDWAKMGHAYGGPDYLLANGIIVNLLQLNYSHIEICVLLGCGNGRVSELNKLRVQGEWKLAPKLRPPPLHALTAKEKQLIADEMEHWKPMLEDGFACAHRRPPYVYFFWPGVKLNRTTEDDCDGCTRLKVALADPDITDIQKAELKAELEVHLNAAIEQRRLMSCFVKGYVAAIDPAQLFPTEDLLEDTLEDITDRTADRLRALAIDAGERVRTLGATVLVQAEDFGGSIPMPFYGFARAQADYFNSNLMLHPYVTTDMVTNVNHVAFFDERGQDKGADCLCSLRMRYHLMQSSLYSTAIIKPRVSISIMDNCVGQNKSQVMMKFFAMLSVLLYDKMVLLYLIPGHSHMKPDRVVGWVKNAIKGLNLYIPNEIVDKVNKVKGIKAEFLDHRSADRPFFVGWEALLNKYFRNMPAGFTAFYFFEFDKGNVTYRHTGSTPDAEAAVHSMLLGDYGAVKKALLQELFGVSSAADLSIDSIQTMKLARHKGNALKLKKVKSLSKKYFSIPRQYLDYYPQVVEDNADDSDSDSEDEDASPGPAPGPAPSPAPGRARNQAHGAAPARKRKRTDVAAGARKPGRPKTVTPPDNVTQRSILGFLTAPPAAVNA